jgi:hypothetical protein
VFLAKLRDLRRYHRLTIWLSRIPGEVVLMICLGGIEGRERLDRAPLRRLPAVVHGPGHRAGVGHGAPGDLQKGYETQVWLAVSNDEKTKVSGRFFYHQREKRYNPEAQNVLLQEKFLERCKEITGISFPQ